MEIVGKKICSRCGIEKENIEFSSNGDYGVYSQCKKCVNEKAKDWYIENTLKKSTYDKQYRILNKDILKQKARRWYEKNKVILSKKMKLYQIKNKDKIKTMCRDYQSKIKGTLEYRIARKAVDAKRRKAGTLDRKIVQMIYEDNIKKFGTLTCLLCECPIEFGQDSLEHIIPISRGGTHEYNNLGVAHLKCNIIKGKKTMMEYREYKHKLERLIYAIP